MAKNVELSAGGVLMDDDGRRLTVGALAATGGTTGQIPTVQADGTIALATPSATSAAATITSVAYAATVTPATNAGGDILNIGALTGNITLGAPTGSPVDGQKLQLRMLQDGTGSRTVTFNAAYAFGTDLTSAMVPSGASVKWEMVFQWDAADSKWRCTGLVRGF